MDNFPVTMNGERDEWVREEENPATSSRRVMSQSQSSSQLQPDNHRVDDLNSSSLSSVDLQTLESSFGRLSFSDSSVRQNGDQIINNRYNQVINGGNNWIHPNGHHHELELQRFNQMQRFNQGQRLSSENDFLYGSFGYDAMRPAMLNNGLSNGVSYLSRNHVSGQNSGDNTNVYRSGFNNSRRSFERLRFNGSHYLENGRGSSILAIAKDEILSEKLKSKINESSQEMFDMIFYDLINHVCDLMVDPFGKNVFQSLMRKCSSEQVTQIIDRATQNSYQFLNICSDFRGNVSIQSLLEYLHRFRCEGQITRMVEAIRRVTLELTKNKASNNVILKCFSLLHVSQYRVILDVIVDNCFRIAIDQHGCFMLQQALTINCDELKNRLTVQIIANAFELSTNSLGNYMVQYLLQLRNPHLINMLVLKLLGNFGNLSRNKYGSHVVQKLLEIRGINHEFILNDLLRDIDTLVVDPFGNYVIHSAWLNTQGYWHIALKCQIKHHIGLMRCNMYGNKLLRKINL